METLSRSSTDKVFFGICGGLGEYLHIDSTVVRLVFILVALFGGASVLVYIALLIIMPERKSVSSNEDISAPSPHATNNKRNDRTVIVGSIFVVMGILFLLMNANILQNVNFNLVWPCMLVACGIVVIVGRRIGLAGVFILLFLFILLCIIFSPTITRWGMPMMQYNYGY